MKTLIITFIAVLISSAAAQAQSWSGKASYYGARGHMTCAHRSLPFGTHVRVTNLSNRRSVVLVVNDRGPFIAGRIVDVSTSAAEALGFRRAGVVKVTMETVSN
ncbi:septal ring lytic transglycosylase RlpA family protein [Methylocapsa aurea]|uniref:septal ring lytic transglycosylase RlpA family protein n=1 Tax=Methylocapsa aurea TaxID=663610 RepID=UPI00055C5F77|nr:septal ring lytic transglycosylase RlpA family protein [Methylocapsa aurea]